MTSDDQTFMIFRRIIEASYTTIEVQTLNHIINTNGADLHYGEQPNFLSLSSHPTWTYLHTTQGEVMNWIMLILAFFASFWLFGIAGGLLAMIFVDDEDQIGLR